MKLGGRKHPGRMADSCKHLSLNWMAAGLGMIIDFSSFLHFYQACFSVSLESPVNKKHIYAQFFFYISMITL